MAEDVLSRRLAAGRSRADRAKAEGNPFFIEEVVRSLREIGAIRRIDGRLRAGRPVDEILVPDTIQDVIIARIDRLDEAPKRALQLASVIGREFTRRLLERLAEIRGAPRRRAARAHGHRADPRRRSFPSWPTCSSTR